MSDTTINTHADNGTTMIFTNALLSDQILEIIGIAGFVFYMLSYGLLQLGKISGQGYTYTVLNMLAATFVLISLLHQFNLASVLIQISWIAISIVGLLRLWTTGRKRHFAKRTKVINY